jgi:hypothetical protein
LPVLAAFSLVGGSGDEDFGDVVFDGDADADVSASRYSRTLVLTLSYSAPSEWYSARVSSRTAGLFTRKAT